MQIEQIASEQNKRSYARIVALAWADEGFKAALFSDPSRVVREHGMKLPAGTTVSLGGTGPGFFAEGTRLELTLPPRPADLVDEPVVTHTSSLYMTAPVTAS